MQVWYMCSRNLESYLSCLLGRIYGLQVAQHMLTARDMPTQDIQYSTMLAGVRLYCSELPPTVHEQVEQAASWMGAVMLPQLADQPSSSSSTVTHVVAAFMTSEARAARRMGLLVLDVEWIEACWSKAVSGS